MNQRQGLNVDKQDVPQRPSEQRVGFSPETPQSRQQAQLKALLDSSPRAARQRANHDMIAGSPPMVAQRALFNSLNRVVQKVDAAEAPKLEKAFRLASAEGEFDRGKYHESLAALEYPHEDDACERDADEPVQLKAMVAQLARAPYAISGPKDYAGLNDVLYQCDGGGNIDFSTPSQYFLGNPYPGLDPVSAGSLVDVGGAVGAYGTGNRYQHFKDANQQLPAFGGVNGSSPAGLTWHHLSAHHQMHLVDRTVHSKHGHNGGVHIW